MTEEEKKAIKWLKELYDIEKDFNSSAGKEESNIIKTLLNLIENLQEEIEERETRLQEEINENCRLKAELYGNSISKDEIRKLMNHYKEKVEEIAKEEEEWKHMNEAQKFKHNVSKRRWTSYYYAYKELLEE